MNLSERDRRRIINFYNRSFKWYRQNALKVRWTEREGQELRFRVLSTIGDLEGRSILDVGSGLGDMYAYLLQNIGEFKYTGIDIVPVFVEEARRLRPGVEFLNLSIDELEGEDRFDYVLSSGALTFKVANNKDYYFSVIRKMFSLSKLGTAFNMLNKEGHSDDLTFASYDPKEIADFCKTITPFVEVSIGYLPEDFTIFMYKERKP